MWSDSIIQISVSSCVITNLESIIWLVADTDGFVIPSLEIEEDKVNNNNDSEVETSKPSSPKVSDWFLTYKTSFKKMLLTLYLSLYDFVE